MVCGGTGLYVRAALDAMEFPQGEQPDNPARAGYERFAAENGAAALHALLRSATPNRRRSIHPNNTRRVVRALEMLDEGVSYAEQSRRSRLGRAFYPTRYIGLTMERASPLSRASTPRVDAMLAEGLLGEVEALLCAGMRDALTARAGDRVQGVRARHRGGRGPRRGGRRDQASVPGATRSGNSRGFVRTRAFVWIDVTESSLEQAADSALETLD